MKEQDLLMLFRYSPTGPSEDDDCFVLRNMITGETHAWILNDAYPADEFLTEEKLEETTVRRCGLQFLRWLSEEDNIEVGDFILLPEEYGPEGLLIVNDEDKLCKKLKHIYEKFSYIGKLNGSPFTIYSINPALIRH